MVAKCTSRLTREMTLRTLIQSTQVLICKNNNAKSKKRNTKLGICLKVSNHLLLPSLTSTVVQTEQNYSSVFIVQFSLKLISYSSECWGHTILLHFHFMCETILRTCKAGKALLKQSLKNQLLMWNMTVCTKFLWEKTQVLGALKRMWVKTFRKWWMIMKDQYEQKMILIEMNAEWKFGAFHHIVNESSLLCLNVVTELLWWSQLTTATVLILRWCHQDFTCITTHFFTNIFHDTHSISLQQQ